MYRLVLADKINVIAPTTESTSSNSITRLLLIYKKGIKDDLSESEKKILRELNERW